MPSFSFSCILQPALDFFGRRVKSGTKGAGELLGDGKYSVANGAISIAWSDSKYSTDLVLYI